MGNNKKTLVVASANKDKLKQLAEIMPEYEIKGYKEFGLDFDIDETGETFYENALIKAKTISQKLNVVSLADDSGLCVDALGGAPGVYSARYAGDGDNEHNNDLLLKNMQGVENRKAKYVCCIVVYFPDGKIVTATGETEGEVLRKRRGTNGFGYDPLFYSYELNESFGMAKSQDVNKINHRSRAINKIREMIDL